MVDLVLFDIDGTLTPSRKRITPEMLDMLTNLRKVAKIGIVGGSDFAKQKDQLGDNVLDLVDYSFPENGVVAYKDGKQFHSNSIKEYLGEDRIHRFVNFVLRYIADLDIPMKRGTFIEFRTGMINVSPIGRNCSYDERLTFSEYDKEHQIRQKMIDALLLEFPDFGLKYSIGGQISFDVFPIGWDKTYCLQHVESESFDSIYFFGDQTQEGGNDHEIFESPKTIGRTVKGPEDTLSQITKLYEI